MAYLVLDDCLGRLFTRVVSYRTSIVEADGGEEDRNANWSNARRLWRCNSQGRLADDLIEKLEMHFHMMRGSWKTFLFKDRGDFNHWQLSTSTAPTAIGTGDAATVAFQLIKLYGSGADTRNRDITNPIDGTVAIYLDGALQTVTTDYTVDHETGIVTFTSAPGDGVAITASFQFRNRVRFASDDLDVAALGPRRKYLSSQFDLLEVRR